MNYIGYIKKLLRQPIGAIPVGLKIRSAGVVLGFERQFEIDGKVRLDVVSDKKKVVSIDGVLKNKPMQIKKINDFILKNRKFNPNLNTTSEEKNKLDKKIKDKTKELVNNLSQEVRDYNNPKKTTSKKTTTKKTTEKKINPDKGGFLFRKTTSGYKQEPKASWSLYKNSKLPNRKFFIRKDNDYWYILDLFSGMSVGGGSTRKQAIESFEKVLEKNSKKFIIDKLDANRLPKKEMDVVMLPYDYVKKQSSKKSPPKKSPPKKSPPKKESNKKSPPKKESNKRVITKKGKAGNLVYVGREKVGKKMLYQYEYKNIPKKK